MTAKLSGLIRDEQLVYCVDNDLAGDPAPMVVKKLRVEYVRGGVAATVVVNEHEFLDIGCVKPPLYEFAKTADGAYTLTSCRAGPFR